MPKTVKLDGAKMQTEAALYDELARVLALPEYFGRNLDALEECLGDVIGDEVVEIVIASSKELEQTAAGQGLITLFREQPKIRLTLE